MERKGGTMKRRKEREETNRRTQNIRAERQKGND